MTLLHQAGEARKGIFISCSLKQENDVYSSLNCMFLECGYLVVLPDWAVALMVCLSWFCLVAIGNQDPGAASP